jgi:hypothetical protein
MKFTCELFAIILIFDIVSVQNECICSSYSGIFCGERSKQNILKGDCELNMLFKCNGYDTEALPKGLCNKCYRNRIFGTDFCDVIEKCEFNFPKYKQLNSSIFEFLFTLKNFI